MALADRTGRGYAGAQTISSNSHLAAILGLDRAELELVARELEDSPECHYTAKDVPKRGGGTRRIDKPGKRIRHIQERIRSRVLRRVRLPEAMLGGVRGRRLTDHAGRHTAQAVVVTHDIAQCYPSTSARAVARMFSVGLMCERQPAALLTRLTTHNGSVPQGGVTSMDVVNLNMLPLCDRLTSLARQHHLSFSMWVDDLAFSGIGAENVIDEVARIVRSHGYRLRRSKKRIMRAVVAQEVTGLGVNATRPSVLRARREQLTEQMFALALTGEVTERELRSIKGKLSWMATISPSQARHLKRLWTRIQPALAAD